jgi:hypothetical protein
VLIPLVLLLQVTVATPSGQPASTVEGTVRDGTARRALSGVAVLE